MVDEYGKLTYINRDVYEGTLNKNDLPDGKGKCKYSDGTYYQGEWKNGKRNGKGTEHCKNKTRKGIWKNGKFTGK